MKINNVDTKTTRKRVAFCIVLTVFLILIPVFVFSKEVGRMPDSVIELITFFQIADGKIFKLDPYYYIVMLVGSVVSVFMALLLEIVRLYFVNAAKEPNKLKYVDFQKDGIFFVFYDSNLNFFSTYDEIKSIRLYISIDNNFTEFLKLPDNSDDIFLGANQFEIEINVNEQIKLSLTNTIALLPKLYIESVICDCSKVKDFDYSIV